MTPTAIILDNIRARYSTPGRKAYLYLFLLNANADRDALIPAESEIMAALVDEGGGLAETPPAQALERATAARQFHTTRPASPHERRLAMARVVTLTIVQQAEDQYIVDLTSRALVFAPKGDRRAVEIWRPAEGSWYSAPIGRE